MSLPRDLLDQLLSGYLDDALSADERRRVESLIAQDQQIARELDELQELRQSVRRLAEMSSSHRLGDDFADRVLAAAIEQAKAENLGGDHPLVRVSSPDTPPPLGRRSGERDSTRPVRLAGILAAVAASIAIAVLWLRPPDDQLPSNHSVAFAEGQSEAIGIDSAVAEDGTAVATARPERVAVSDHPQSVPAAPAAKSTAGPELDRGGKPAAGDRAVSTSPIAMADGRTGSEAGQPRHTAESAGTTGTAPNSPATVQIGAILVLDVRLTDVGQMENAIRLAMQAANLDPASRKQLPDQLVGHLQQHSEALESGDRVSVVYLQAPAKQLDRFYLALLADEAGVESVGMSLAMNAPILQVVQSIAVDPTTIRHANTALEFSSDSGAVDQLAGELSRLQFAPLNRQAAGAMTPSGPDVPAQILVLVR